MHRVSHTPLAAWVEVDLLSVHHPDPSTILAFGAGTLDEAFSIVVACHLETCASCRDVLKTSELVGGTLLDACAQTTLDGQVYSNVLESITDEQPVFCKTNGEGRGQLDSTPNVQWGSTPIALRHYLEMPLTQIDWNRAGVGVWQKPIALSKHCTSSLRLLRISSGRKVPEHGHGGQEMTLVLSGGYEDEMGYFGPGDVADLDEHVEHQPHVVSQEDCICIAATQAATRFKGLAGRILQPFIRI